MLAHNKYGKYLLLKCLEIIQYKVVSSVKSGSAMSGFSNEDCRVNVVSYDSNTLQYALG